MCFGLLVSVQAGYHTQKDSAYGIPYGKNFRKTKKMADIFYSPE